MTQGGQVYVLELAPSESMDSVRPWVARIIGTSPKFGLERRFVEVLTDYSGSSRSCAGRLRGVVYAFPLRVGWVVEAQHYRRTRSKRHLTRYFAVVRAGGLEELSAETVAAWAERVEEARLAAAWYPGPSDLPPDDAARR